MKVFTTDKIRNVAILGHSSSGKTSLLYAMRRIAGERIKESTPESTSLLSVHPILWEDCKINFIDTPGSFDFIGEMQQALSAADAAIIVVSGRNGVENGTKRAWKMCEEFNIPRIVYVSDMDIDDVSYKNVVTSLQDLYGKHIAPFHFPLRENGEFAGYINVIQQKAKRWKADGTIDKSDVPDYSQENLELYREVLMESVAETSEEFMDRYFAGETFSDMEIRQALRVNVAEGSIIPVLMGSNIMARGMYTLLADIIKYLPSPDQRKYAGINATSNEVFNADYNFALAKSAYVFKTIVDPYIGKYSLFKVASGVIKSDDVLYNYHKSDEFKASKIYVLNGSNAEEVSEIHAGDIGALSKVSSLATTDSISTKANPILYIRASISTPYCTLGYEANNPKEIEKVTQSLSKLAEEDPTLKVENDKETKQLIVRGISEQHLAAIAQRLKDKYKCEINLVKPRVAYKETVTGTSDVEYKHKKQSGGHGQYGHVKIKVSPASDPTVPYEFEETVVGGAVPKNFFPAVEKGISDGVKEGPLAGFPVVGVHINLYDGSSHSVDSSEAAFKTASTMALKDGILKAKPVLLEPISSLIVEAPDDAVGDILGELSKRRGRIIGMTPEGGITKVDAQLPYATLYGLGNVLHSLSGGEATYSYEFLQYEPAPEGTVEKD